MLESSQTVKNRSFPRDSGEFRDSRDSFSEKTPFPFRNEPFSGPGLLCSKGKPEFPGLETFVGPPKSCFGGR